MWRYTASVDYAIKILICLAKEKKSLSSTMLAKQISTSPRYVLHICRRLKDAGIVAVVYGIHGGFTLQIEPSNISIYDVASAIGLDMEFRHDIEIDSYFDKLADFHDKQTATLLSKLRFTSIADLI